MIKSFLFFYCYRSTEVRWLVNIVKLRLASLKKSIFLYEVWNIALRVFTLDRARLKACDVGSLNDDVWHGMMLMEDWNEVSFFWSFWREMTAQRLRVALHGRRWHISALSYKISFLMFFTHKNSLKPLSNLTNCVLTSQKFPVTVHCHVNVQDHVLYAFFIDN